MPQGVQAVFQGRRGAGWSLPGGQEPFIEQAQSCCLSTPHEVAGGECEQSSTQLSECERRADAATQTQVQCTCCRWLHTFLWWELLKSGKCCRCAQVHVWEAGPTHHVGHVRPLHTGLVLVWLFPLTCVAFLSALQSLSASSAQLSASCMQTCR